MLVCECRCSVHDTELSGNITHPSECSMLFYRNSTSLLIMSRAQQTTALETSGTLQTHCIVRYVAMLFSVASLLIVLVLLTIKSEF